MSFEGVVRIVREALALCKGEEEVNKFVKLNNVSIGLLEKLIRKCGVSVGKKRHYERVLGLIKGYGGQLKAKRRGAVRAAGVKWINVSIKMYRFLKY